MTVRGERWDVVVRVVGGAGTSPDNQVLRGPVIRIGSGPDAALPLPQARGVASRHCVITAYEQDRVGVTPVGEHATRLAPHPGIDWSDIDPLREPALLSPGCVLHLGPVSQGATIEIVSIRRLGAWQPGALASEVEPPPSVDARRVGRVQADAPPMWFVGGVLLVAIVTATTVLLAGATLYLDREVVALGPVEEGQESWDSVQVPQSHELALLDGLEQPYQWFVMRPNIEAARAAGLGWDAPEAWDRAFLEHVTASVHRHGRSWRFYQRLEAVRAEWATVLTAVRQAGLPDVVAAIPYQESRYRPRASSEVCALGYWQLMPEVAHRLQMAGLPMRIGTCSLRGGATFVPTQLAPPPNARRRAPYVDDSGCRILDCDPDDRTDLEPATQAALHTLREAWDDPAMRRSGSLVQLTLTSHISGYDDARFGPSTAKSTNVRPALEAWLEEHPDEGLWFVGKSIRCATHDTPGRCGSVFPAAAQHYAYTIVAQHFLAVCYYAANHGDDPAFRPWAPFVADEGYCAAFDVPDKDAVRARGGR